MKRNSDLWGEKKNKELDRYYKEIMHKCEELPDQNNCLEVSKDSI